MSLERNINDAPPPTTTRKSLCAANALYTAALMTVALFVLFVCVAVVIVVERRRVNARSANADRRREEPLSKEGAFRLLMHDRYLLLIGALVILLNWVNSSGEYLLDRALLVATSEASARGANPQEFVGAFKANYFAYYNAIGMVLQLFVVSRVLAVVGVRGALLVMPTFALVVVNTYLSVFANVRRPSSMPRRMTSRWRSRSTKSAAALATSTAVSTDRLASAACIAGASFTPSPRNPTTCPVFLSDSKMRSF